MPLNYSKWDKVELSDDSDIEGHPNVDKRSLIKWHQRDIHEKREARKHKIASLETEIACNNVLLDRLNSILADLNAATSPTSLLNDLILRLTTNPSQDAPPVNSLGQAPSITYDQMLLSLLSQIKQASNSDQAIIDGLSSHITKLSDAQKTHAKDLAFERKEQAKRITVEDIHDGFDNKYVPPKPNPPSIPIPASSDKPKDRKTTTTFEVLNPQPDPEPEVENNDNNNNEEEETLPELTPSLIAFSNIPIKAFEQSWQFIQNHRDVVVPGASDALLVAAFRAQSDGKSAYAKQCVHQSLLLQYCDKLGGDGVRVFFRRMIGANQRAESVFMTDVEKTYAHLQERVRISLQESTGTEQIQLVPENPSQSISFNVPDGPPQEKLVLEGPGTEDLDVEEVRKALQLRWDVFQTFPDELKAALKEGTLDGVNRVLGSMPVDQAEQIVSSLDMAGILNFAEGGIRDETGKDDEVEG